MFLSETGAEMFGNAVKYFGVPGAIFLAIIFAMQKGWLITGREHNDDLRRYEALKTEKDYWRDLALRATTTAEKATAVAQRINSQEGH